MSVTPQFADELFLLCRKSKAVKCFVLNFCLILPKASNNYITEYKASRIIHFVIELHLIKAAAKVERAYFTRPFCDEWMLIGENVFSRKTVTRHYFAHFVLCGNLTLILLALINGTPEVTRKYRK